MTDCQQFEEELIMSDELSPQARSHMKECRSCTNLDQVRHHMATAGIVSTKVPEPPLGSWVGGAMDKLKRKRRQQTALVGAAVVGAAAGFFMMRGQGQESAPVATTPAVSNETQPAVADTPPPISHPSIAGAGPMKHPSDQPAWLPPDAHNMTSEARCTVEATQMSCIGVPGYHDDRDIAKLQAHRLAMAKLTFEIAKRVEDPDFRAALRASKAHMVKQKLIDELLTNIKDIPADRAHERLDQVLMPIAARAQAWSEAMPTQLSDHYWQEFEKLDGSGTEFLVYGRITVSLDKLRELGERARSNPAAYLAIFAQPVCDPSDPLCGL